MPVGKPAALSPPVTIRSETSIQPFLAEIHELISRQQQLGPGERGREDEIRCALAGLLTDENAGWLVKNLLLTERQSEFGVSALSRWAEQDGLAATLWLAQQPTPSKEQTWVIAHALAHDPVALSVLCELLPPTAWRETLIEGASFARMPDSPRDAARLAQRLQSGPRRTEVCAAIADEWASRDPAAAVRWIATETDFRVRDELLFSAATSCAFVDPAAAIDSTVGITSDVVYARTIDKLSAMWTDSAADPAARLGVSVALKRTVSGESPSRSLPENFYPANPQPPY